MSATLDELNVRAARERRLAPIIARETGLSYGVVRGRLVRAHGRTLLRNLFADVWTTPATLTQQLARRPRSPRRVAAQEIRAAGPHTIHRVRQEFSTSCGVAVVAMLARVTHAEALAFLFPTTARNYRTWLKDLKRALDHFGVTYAPRWSRFRSWREIPSTSLVKVRWNANGTSDLHWVIFQRRDNGEWRVIDPDPPRRSGTLRLSERELSHFTGITYLAVNARRTK